MKCILIKQCLYDIIFDNITSTILENFRDNQNNLLRNVKNVLKISSSVNKNDINRREHRVE